MMNSLTMSARVMATAPRATCVQTRSKCQLVPAGLPSALRQAVASRSAPAMASRRRSVVVRADVGASASELRATPSGAPASANKNDLSAALGLVAFVASMYSSYTFTVTNVLRALSILLAVNATSAILTGENYVGDKVSLVVGPATLAAYVLTLHTSIGPIGEVGNILVLLLGVYLARDIDIGPPVTFWIWVSSLLYALYADKGALWFTVVAGIKWLNDIYKNFQNRDAPLPYIEIAGLAGTIYAAWSKNYSQWVLSLALGVVTWSGIKLLENLIGTSSAKKNN